MAPDEPMGPAGEQEWDPETDPDVSGPDDSGPIPHPLDRVWFHPSELSAYVERQVPTAPRGQWRAPAAVLVVGALLIGAVALIGDNGRAGPGSGDVAAAALLGATSAQRSPSRQSIVTVRERTSDGEQRLLGSGIAIDRDAVLTTAHAVHGLQTVVVATNGGASGSATVVGVDVRTDLALLKVTGIELVPALLGSGDAVAPGSRVVAIANQGFATAGYVRAVQQMAPGPGGTVLVGLVELGFSTPDSAGGGAVVDTDGAVVAILLGVTDGGGDAALAVPVEVAKDVADQLAYSGRAVHAWMGATLEDSMRGPAVTDLAPRGPAAAAGLRKGDVVTEVGGRDVRSVGEVLAAVQRRRPGDPLDLAVERAGREVRVTVPLAPAPAVTTTTVARREPSEEALGPDLPGPRSAATMDG